MIDFKIYFKVVVSIVFVIAGEEEVTTLQSALCMDLVGSGELHCLVKVRESSRLDLCGFMRFG